MRHWVFAVLFACVAWLASPRDASAEELTELTRGLMATDDATVEKVVLSISQRTEPAALHTLSALLDGNLRVDAAGHPFLNVAGKLQPILANGPKEPQGKLATPSVDNRLRRSLEPVIASMKLSSPDRSIRLAAAEDLAKRRSDDLAPLLRKAQAKEQDSTVRSAITLALAQIDLAGSDKALRLAAISAMQESGDGQYKPDLDRLLTKDETGKFREPDESVRRAAAAALSRIESRMFLYGMVGNVFYGLSLGSVLLLAALGLAITFGLMRVINMAHGELLMIGAYATYSVQRLFEQHFPAQQDLYLIFAIPAAFAASATVGYLIERSVLRFLYGRPLETLLATWGISLILIQTVRLIFGAQNVTVANPSWLAGGVPLLPGFVLTYSRVAVILFSAVVVAFVWFTLQKTPLGLHVRAVTQNRQMAAGMGIPTRRVDSWTFAIGSGVAGLGGVALSQLGNVGPELGQGYIVDSFMVVVLGGVGKLAGTLAGAFGLGMVNKLLEPVAGAVLGKIAILGFIILFIQRRPQGIFALKGRSAEVA